MTNQNCKRGKDVTNYINYFGSRVGNGIDNFNYRIKLFCILLIKTY